MIKFGLDYIPATERGKPTLSYFDSRGSNSSRISVFQHESESLISPRNLAALSRGSASTICACLAALARYDLRSRRFFMTKKAKSGTTIRSRDSARYLLPETSQILR